MQKHLEIKTVEHKGIKVTVKLDYVHGTASLVEVLRANGDLQTTAKKWVFAGRTLDYMNGWLNILEAMKKAVEFCKKELEADLAESSKFSDMEAAALLEAGAKVVYAKKPAKKRK